MHVFLWSGFEEGGLVDNGLFPGDAKAAEAGPAGVCHVAVWVMMVR